MICLSNKMVQPFAKYFIFSISFQNPPLISLLDPSKICCFFTAAIPSLSLIQIALKHCKKALFSGSMLLKIFPKFAAYFAFRPFQNSLLTTLSELSNHSTDLDKIKYKLVIMDHSEPLKKNCFSGNQRALFSQGGTTQMERLICFPPWG